MKETDHYLPSILFVCWDSKGVHEDITTTVQEHIAKGKIGASATATLSSDDPDRVFVDVLRTLELDVQGEMVEFLSISGKHLWTFAFL